MFLNDYDSVLIVSGFIEISSLVVIKIFICTSDLEGISTFLFLSTSNFL
jgi:hypothetical protein